MPLGTNQEDSVGLFSDFGRKDGKFISEPEFLKSLKTQLDMSPQTVAVLRGYGVSADDSLRLQFFFVTDAESKAAALASALAEKGYSVEYGISGNYKNKYLGTAWFIPIRMDEPVIVEWTKNMCELAYKHDCEFDGWETSPDQEKT